MEAGTRRGKVRSDRGSHRCRSSLRKSRVRNRTGSRADAYRPHCAWSGFNPASHVLAPVAWNVMTFEVPLNPHTR